MVARNVAWAVGAMRCGRFATNLSLSNKGPAVSEVPRSRAETINLMAEYIASGALGANIFSILNPEARGSRVQELVQGLKQGLRVLRQGSGFRWEKV